MLVSIVCGAHNVFSLCPVHVSDTVWDHNSGPTGALSVYPSRWPATTLTFSCSRCTFNNNTQNPLPANISTAVGPAVTLYSLGPYDALSVSKSNFSCNGEPLVNGTFPFPIQILPTNATAIKQVAVLTVVNASVNSQCSFT